MIDVDKYLNGLKIKKDELTSIERDALYSAGKDVDRMPCCLDTGETMAPLIGISLDEYYHSSDRMLELELYLYENFHSDGAGVSMTLRGMAEAMGSEIRYSDNSIAVLEKPALDSLDDVDKLKLVDIEKDGRLPIIIDGWKKVKKALGDKVPVSGTVTGPFTIASMLIGTEKLLIGTIKQPEKVHQMMEIIAENNNRIIQRMIDLEIGIGFADPVSSSSLLRRKQYQEFSLPYFQKNVDFIHSQGRNCGLHICGGSKALWEDLNKTGIGLFGLDNCEDMAEAKEILGPHMMIQGNVPPVEVMLKGTPKDVLLSAKECIAKAWDSPNRMVLTSGCQMPLGTPKENMMALMDAARIFGQWPIRPEVLE